MATWVLETTVFSDNHQRLVDAARTAGHLVVEWDDQSWSTGQFPKLSAGPVVFHGSLGNANRIRSEGFWQPGAYCNTPNFECTAWYAAAAKWLIHKKWVFTKAIEFVRDPYPILNQLDGSIEFFVRPNSPLKPFAGRVLTVEKLSLAALDHGFYYEDETIPIVVAPIVKIDSESRFVVVNKTIVAGSSYEARNRMESDTEPSSDEWNYAQQIAEQLPSPEMVYVIDLCRSGGEIRLIEINPFSGADLYHCDRAAIVDSVISAALQAY